MEDILNPAPAAETVEDQTQTHQPAGDQPQGDGAGADGGAPTAQQEDPRVPLAALTAERKERQDWKEKASRAEGELQALREQLARQQQQPPAQLDPLQSFQQQLINERFNTSEMLVKQAHADADEVVGVFMEAAKANPALAAALQTQRHPWDFAYREGKRLRMLKEVGDDPNAYREKVKAELLAELQKTTPPVLNVPASLNGARSVAPRSAPGFTGPTPLEGILGR